MFRKFVAFVSMLLLLAACQLQSSDPPAQTPTLTITPASININAGDAPATFVATVQNSTEAVTWVYTGPGSITPSAGPITTYTPPESVDSVQSGSLTATLGATGVTAVAPIAIYPADVAPPPDPPDPPDPGPDPDPDPDPGPDPGPDPDPPADLSVSIANVDPVTLGEGGTASVNLNASTSNAPGGTTYQWAAQGDSAGNVTFSSPTSEDTTATFSAEGNYTLRLTASSGSQSDSDTVEVTVNPAPQTVEGVWTGTLTATGSPPVDFTLDLEQTGEDVTGTLTVATLNYPVEGTFDGTDLELASGSGSPIPFTLDATVSGDAMTGTVVDTVATYSLTATRTPAP